MNLFINQKEIVKLTISLQNSYCIIYDFVLYENIKFINNYLIDNDIVINTLNITLTNKNFNIEIIPHSSPEYDSILSLLNNPLYKPLFCIDDEIFNINNNYNFNDNIFLTETIKKIDQQIDDLNTENNLYSTIILTEHLTDDDIIDNNIIDNNVIDNNIFDSDMYNTLTNI